MALILNKDTINKTNNDGMTALHFSVMECNDFDKAVLLVKLGADLIVTNNYGGSTFKCLLEKKDNDDKIFLLLNEYLKNFGNINHVDRYGKTMLYLACCEGRMEVVKFLLKNGADPNICTHDGENILFWIDNRKGDLSKLIDLLSDQGKAVCN